jgi:multicomponent K+:H+ antiporter subunit D
MLSTALGGSAPPGAEAWWMTGTMIVSGLAVLIAMARSGINIFWATLEPGAVTARLSEMAPIVVLLALCIAIGILPAPILDYMEGAANLVSVPEFYVLEIMGPEAATTLIRETTQ